MIYVTMGHERSVSLEIFFRALEFVFPTITLIVVRKDLTRFLFDYCFKYKIRGNKLILSELEIPLIFVEGTLPSSTLAMNRAMEIMTSDDILITMPTSKDQLIFKGHVVAGHTEFFRNFYRDMNIPMVFLGNSGPLLLISDHVPLRDVGKISTQLIYKKVSITIDNFSRYFYPLEKVIIAGFNPHAGEGGIIGSEHKVQGAISRLQRNFAMPFIGPLSGDSLFLHRNRRTLLVYMYHDQGLGPFKAVNKFKGINLTLGLPFLRLSVDHGTAFELYGKNVADISGMIFVLKWAKRVYERFNNK
jgi:4-hydroxythreonine-4-phosphate dehydrogenase